MRYARKQRYSKHQTLIEKKVVCVVVFLLSEARRAQLIEPCATFNK